MLSDGGSESELPAVPAEWRDYQRQVAQAMREEGMTREDLRFAVAVMISILCGIPRPEYFGLLDKQLAIALERGLAALTVLDVVMLVAPRWLDSGYLEGDRPKDCDSCAQPIRSTPRLRNEAVHHAGVIWLCDPCAAGLAAVAPSIVLDVRPI